MRAAFAALVCVIAVGSLAADLLFLDYFGPTILLGLPLQRGEEAGFLHSRWPQLQRNRASILDDCLQRGDDRFRDTTGRDGLRAQLTADR